MPTSAQCPSCDARFIVGDTSAGCWSCARCKTVVAGALGEPERWLYPLPDRAEGAPAMEGASFGKTAATLDPDGTGEPEDPEQPTDDRYELRGELGRGGMGVVYSAWDRQLHRPVALKVLTSGRFASEKELARFVGEARAAAKLDHPGIVRVNDLGSVDDQPYFTMERVEGPSLSGVLESCGPLPIHEAARIVERVARAVQHAHDAGVVHRDLKPGNVLLTCEGEPRVTDFGLARLLDVESHLTATEQILGTPAFMAPESARGERDIAWVLADVYGVGALLYAALTGGPPAVGATLADVLEAAARGRRPQLRRPDIPQALVGVLDRSLKPEPERRYPSARAVADDLARFLAGETVEARPEGLTERGARWARRRRLLLSIGAIGAAGVAAALLVPELMEAREHALREADASTAWGETAQLMEAAAVEGNAEYADFLFDAFVEAPRHTGTGAVSDAWIARGDGVAPSPRSWLGVPDSRPAALWSQALLTATDDARAATALLRIARWQLETASAVDGYDGAGALLDAAERLGGAEQEAERLLLRLRWAVNTGRIDAAAEAWDQAQALGLPEADTYADPRRVRGLSAPGPSTGTGHTAGGAPDPLQAQRGAIEGFTPDARGVAEADLDGDGAPELAIASGGWRSYDLRILGPDGEGGLRQRARRRRSAAEQVAAIPDRWSPGRHLVATWETDQYANVEVFGADAPRGPAAGLLIHRLTDDALEEVFFWPTHGEVIEGIRGADLDGDGQLEVLASVRGAGDIVLWPDQAPDTFTYARLPSLDPARSADAARPSGAAPSAPPGLLDSPAARAWEGIRAMASAGLIAQAAEAMTQLVERAPASAAAEVAASAAALWGEAGRPDRAALSWERAERWEEVVRERLAAADPAGALAAARRWEALDGPGPPEALAAEVARWRESRDHSVSFAGGAVHPSWRIEEPLAVGERAGALYVDAMSGENALAELPLRWAGGPVALALDLRVDRLEPDSGLTLQLGGGEGGEDGAALGLSVVGGGGLHRALAACDVGPAAAVGDPAAGDPSVSEALESAVLDGDAPTVALQLRMTWSPEDDAWTCAVSLPSRGTAAIARAPGGAPSEALTLTIREAGGAPGRWMGAAVERLELWGVDAAAPSEVNHHRVNMALVKRKPDVALALEPAGDTLAPALALAQMGRISAAVEALRDIDPARLERSAAYLLRARRETWAPLLREALGEDFVPLFQRVWADEQLLSASWTQEALFEDLAGLDLLSLSPALGARRAIALLNAGQLNQGAQESLAWLVRWSMLSPEDGESLREQAAHIHLAMALGAAEDGADSRAMRHAGQSVRVSPYPELITDQLTASEVWRDRELGIPSPR